MALVINDQREVELKGRILIMAGIPRFPARLPRPSHPPRGAGCAGRARPPRPGADPLLFY